MPKNTLGNMLSFIGTFIVLACFTAYPIGLLLFFPQTSRPKLLSTFQLFPLRTHWPNDSPYYNSHHIHNSEPTPPIRLRAIVIVTTFYSIPSIIGGLFFRYIAGNPIEAKRTIAKKTKSIYNILSK